MDTQSSNKQPGRQHLKDSHSDGLFKNSHSKVKDVRIVTPTIGNTVINESSYHSRSKDANLALRLQYSGTNGRRAEGADKVVTGGSRTKVEVNLSDFFQAEASNGMDPSESNSSRRKSRLPQVRPTERGSSNLGKRRSNQGYVDLFIT